MPAPTTSRSNSDVVRRLGSRRTRLVFYDSGMHPTAARPQGAAPTTVTAADVARYWNTRIHDLEMTTHEVGTREFFDDLDDYRFDKLHYLPKLVDFNGFAGKQVLEIGCGIGTDLVRFAKGGARVTGIDLAQTSIDMARQNFALHGVTAEDLRVADGAALPFDQASFDVVYAHGVMQYAPDAPALVAEARRVLRPDGLAIFMVYNRVSWLQAMSKVMKVGLEHGDAPVLQLYSIPEFRALLAPFRDVDIVPERFPVASRLHKGWKATAYNSIFVGTFNALPRAWVRRYGWHLMAFCRP
jgi:SAM-dependent methyltransferase